jgi:hypothetical protein
MTDWIPTPHERRIMDKMTDRIFQPEKLAIIDMVRDARADLTREAQPRDRFEHAVIAALGEITWDEAVRAINDHRSGKCYLLEVNALRRGCGE